MEHDGGVAAIWKTIALVLVTIMVTGTPGIVYALRTWSIGANVDLIQTRQDDVRDRLARLETKYDNLLAQVQVQEQQIRDLQSAGP